MAMPCLAVDIVVFSAPYIDNICRRLVRKGRLGVVDMGSAQTVAEDGHRNHYRVFGLSHESVHCMGRRPCQDISHLNARGLGLRGKTSMCVLA